MDTMADTSKEPLRGNRVCNHCQRRKTKCSREKPTCSRCAEHRWECSYTSTRRKPGPARRAHVDSSRPGSEGTYTSTDNGPQLFPVLPSHDHTQGRPTTQANANRGLRYASSLLSPSEGISPEDRHTPSIPESLWKGYKMIDLEDTPAEDEPCQYLLLTPEIELELIDIFFESIQPHYPLFQKPIFLQKYRSGQLPRSMLSAVFAVSITLSTNLDIVAMGPSAVSKACAASAWQACSNTILSDATTTIDDLRTLFLLTLYEVRNLPSRKVWNLAGHLLRLAYFHGLHRIDSTATGLLYAAEDAGATELETRRYLWWSIYTLDTCCNVSLATPANTDLDAMCTCLPSGNVEAWTNGGHAHVQINRIFLCNDIQGFSEILRNISSSWLRDVGENIVDVNFAIRIINTSQLREVSNLSQAMTHNPTARAHQRMRYLSDSLTAFRLALQARYFDSRRNRAAGETKNSHALRLMNLMEINVTTLYLAMLKLFRQEDSRVWLNDWDAVAETVDDIVQIIKNWDPRTLGLLEPIVGYIAFVSSVILQIDIKLLNRNSEPSALEDTRETSWQLLILFLRQLGNHWLLSKTLVAAAENFRRAASSSIDLADASQILISLQKPLNFHPTSNQVPSGDATSDGQPSQELFFGDNADITTFMDWFNLADLDPLPKA